MTGKLRAEIRQKKPFSSLEEEALLNIHRTADVLDQRMTEVLKPHGLTGRQYNVLRILRGAGDAGASCKEIGARMVSADPDVTRLVDRLEARGLVARGRSQSDRRVVTILVTQPGLAVLESLDRHVEDLALHLMKTLERTELKTLISLLERLRSIEP